MKSKILKELKNADDYISGQQLCERLGVSRTAVWKHIKALRAEGYEIDSVTNKGYKLMMEPDVLTKEEVASCLHTKWLGKDLHCYETMDSTNLEIRRLAEAGAGHGIVQSQKNRQWEKEEEDEAGWQKLSRDRDELSSKTSDRSSEFFYAYVSYCISGK